jgi:trigger factor
MAMQYGQRAKDIRKAYEDNEAVPELAAQIRKSKAFDWLLHNIDFVDPAGAAIDRDTLLGHTHDDDDDHDDHDGHEHGDVDVKSAAAAVIAATDAAAAGADDADAADPSSNDDNDSEEETS